MLIIRRTNCINTASGIVFFVSDRPVCTHRLSQNNEISNFVKIRPVRAALFHADRQTDRQTDMIKLFCERA